MGGVEHRDSAAAKSLIKTVELTTLLSGWRLADLIACGGLWETKIDPTGKVSEFDGSNNVSYIAND